MGLPLVLLFAGVVIIFYALRKQNPLEEDLMTALKGLVHLKKEIIRVEDDLYDIRKSVEESVNNVYMLEREPSLVTKHPDGSDQAGIIAKAQNTDMNKPSLGQNANQDAYAQSYQQSENTVIFMDREKYVKKEPQRSALPDKYQRVLLLARQGYKEKQIAQELELSQDAVNLILRSYAKGESV